MIQNTPLPLYLQHPIINTTELGPVSKVAAGVHRHDITKGSSAGMGDGLVSGDNLFEYIYMCV